MRILKGIYEYLKKIKLKLSCSASILEEEDKAKTSSNSI